MDLALGFTIIAALEFSEDSHRCFCQLVKGVSFLCTLTLPCHFDHDHRTLRRNVWSCTRWDSDSI